MMFVCVEVLRPSQPNGVMSSAVRLPNHMFTGQAYGKCPKISNTLKFPTPNILSKIISGNVLKSRTVTVLQNGDFENFEHSFLQISFLSAHSNFSNVFFVVFFFPFPEPETKVVVLKATAKLKCSSVITNFMYINGMGTVF